MIQGRILSLKIELNFKKYVNPATLCDWAVQIGGLRAAGPGGTGDPPGARGDRGPPGGPGALLPHDREMK